jgi:SAM-dependent methyltransferase
MTGSAASQSQTSLDDVREAERAHFDARYAWRDPIQRDTPETFLPCITPEYKPGGVSGGLVHLELWKRLMSHGVAGRDLLDYASGAGHWGIRLAQAGALVRGFDLSPIGVDRANRRARLASVDASFICADASSLPFGDGSFDVVVGIGALHHTIKYPGTAAELHRVTRPGALCVFAENIDGGWWLRVARRWTMRHEAQAGDVILTEEMIRRWAWSFADVSVHRYELLLMAKKLKLPRRVLAVLHGIDQMLFRVAPFTRRWCGECVVVLTR